MNYPQRWLVRLLVTRVEGEAEPAAWNWDELFQGGDPVVLRAELVGWDVEYEAESA